MGGFLDIYDPVRIELEDDIAQRLINKDEKCDCEMRVTAMSCISQLRNIIHDLAPRGSTNYRFVSSKLSHEAFKFLYWDEYAAEQYRRIDARKKAEQTATEWIGA